MSQDWTQTYAGVLGRLPGFKDYGAGRGRAVCPCDHGTKRAALWLSVSDKGHLLLRCFPADSGSPACQPRDVLARVGLNWNDLFPPLRRGTRQSGKGADVATATASKPAGKPAEREAEKERWAVEAEYEYEDPDLPPGTDGRPALSYIVQKRRFESGRKEFKQRAPNPAYDSRRAQSRDNEPWVWTTKGIKKVLWHLPELRAKLREKRERYVFVVEGEGDVLTAESVGLVATCNPGGAGKWEPQFTAELKGCNVVLIPDEDPVAEMPGKAGVFVCPGVDHVRLVAGQLLGQAASITVLRLPDVPAHGDLTDWRRLAACPDANALKRIQALVMSDGIKIACQADIDRICPRGEDVWPCPPGAWPKTVPPAPPSGQQGLFDGPSDKAADPPPAAESKSPGQAGVPAVDVPPSVRELATVMADLRRVAPNPPRSVGEWAGEVLMAWQRYLSGLEAAADGDNSKVRQAALILAAQLVRGLPVTQ